MSLRARLPELGAIVRAYAPGRKIRAHVAERDMRGASTLALAEQLERAGKEGIEIAIAEGFDWRHREQGERAKGRIVGIAWIVEVEIPEPDVLPEIDPNQQTLA